MDRTREQLEQDAERIFLDALERAPDARDSYVDAECENEAPLRARVNELLAHATAAPAGFLLNDMHSPTRGHGTRNRPADAAPHKIGPYTVVGLLGVGGMGAVYEAIETDTQRKVAIKLLQSAFATPTQLARFRREAGILAKLNHPAIAKLYGVGSAETLFGSHPYIAMEFIAGRNLRDWGREHERSIRHRVELMATICDAVQASHEQGIVHRDLKPANILVNESGDPRILDFGISRITTPGNATPTINTETGQFVGTPAYMSPEQISGDTNRIDARSDIFSLGVILYELLSGVLPFDVGGRSIEGAAQLIREEDPSHLSHFDSAFRGNLAAIVTKALEKDPSRRYPTAGEMARDLRRHLNSEAITARNPTAIRRFARFSRRHRKLVIGTTCVFAALIATSFIATRIAVRESRLRALAERKNHRANLLSAQLALQSDNFVEARRIVENLADAGAGTWEYKHLRDCLKSHAIVFAGHTAAITSVDVSSDGKRILSASEDGTIRIWDTTNGSHRVMRGHSRPVREALFLKQEAQVASLSDDGTIRLWDAASLREVGRIKGNDWSPIRMDISPNEKRIAATCSDQRIRIWELDTGRLVLTSAPHAIPISVLRYLDDARIVVGEHRGLSCWSAKSGAWLSFSDGGFDFHPSSIFVGKDGTQLLTSCADSTITVWDVDALQPRRKLIGQLGGVNGAKIDASGARIVSAGADNTVRVWNAQNGQQVAKFVGHTDAVHAVATIPDTPLLVSGSADFTIRLWNLLEAGRSGGCRVLTGHQRYVYDVAFQPGSDVLASAAWDGTVRFWDTKTGSNKQTLDADPERVECLAFSPDGCLMATGTSGNTVKLWDVKSLTLVRTFTLSRNSIRTLAIGPQGRYLAATRGSPYNANSTWNSVTWRISDGVVMSRLAANAPLIATSSPRGLRLVKAIPGEAVMIDPLTAAPLFAFSGHDDLITNVTFSNDGTRFLTASDDSNAAVWDAESGVQLAVLRGHSNKVYDAVFSPDGQRIATGSNDNTIRLWDANDFEELLVLPGHTKYVYSLAFNSRGDMLASGSGDHTVRIWTATTESHDGLPARIP